MTGAGFSLNPRIDWDAARQAFARDGRVRIDPFLVDEDARRLRASLVASEEWRLVLNAGDKVYEIDRPGQRALNAAAHAELDRLVATAARSGFQYRYESIRVPDSAVERTALASPLAAFSRFLSSAPVVSAMRNVIAAPDIEFADAQATRYDIGHFLTSHDDDVPGKSRRAAYVLGLTDQWRAEWGGLLMFHGADGHIDRAFSPGFNVITLFAVPQAHSVSYVCPFAPEPRVSVTGWLRGGRIP